MKKNSPPLLSVKTLMKDFDSIYEQAGIIFDEYNLCQWEHNADGTVSCVVNRLNSQKNNSQFIETDGCCIDICKSPKDFNDKVIKRKQHNNKNGCLIKCLKCKLHTCKFLKESNDLNTREAMGKLEQLINSFRLKYDLLWTSIPYGSSKRIWIETYKNQRN